MALSGKESEKGDVAFILELFPFLTVVILLLGADDEFLQVFKFLLTGIF